MGEGEGVKVNHARHRKPQLVTGHSNAKYSQCSCFRFILFKVPIDNKTFLSSRAKGEQTDLIGATRQKGTQPQTSESTTITLAWHAKNTR